MALNTINTDAISFKKLSGKVHTQQNFAVTEEGISTNVQMSYSTVFAQPIVKLPVTQSGLTALYATNGIVERVKFQIDIIPDTQIAAGRSQGYRLKLPSDYNTFGELFPEFSAGTYLHTALGKLQIVPALYGTLKPDGSTEYDPILYQTNGSTVIAKFDPINWYLDTYSGILFVQDPPAGYDVSASRPGFVEAFLYVGDYIDDVIFSVASGSTGTTGQNVGGGVGVFKDKIVTSGGTGVLRFKSFAGIQGISVTGDTDSVIIGFSGTSATTVTANNGLTKVGQDIILGGTLTGETTLRHNVEYNSIDNTFVTGSGFDSTVLSVAQQPDDKLIVGGFFFTYSGVTVNGLVRLNPDGSIDDTFAVGSYFPTAGVVNVHSVSGNKVLVTGYFASYSGETANKIIRLNSDGSIDYTFTGGTGFETPGFAVSTSVIQSDGKILAGGEFDIYSGVTSNRIIRLHPNGSIDESFVIGSGFNFGVNGIAEQSDNKLVVVGYFTEYSGVSKNAIIRLNPNGSIDESFATGLTGFDLSGAQSVEIQPDGKIVIVGQFTTYDGQPHGRIVRLNSDGTVDTAFQSGTGFDAPVYGITILPNGKFLVTGDFFSYNGVDALRVIRLNSDGTIDSTFGGGTTLADSVWSSFRQSDGKLIFNGIITEFSGQTGFGGIVRLNNVEFESPLVKFKSNGLEYGSDFSSLYTDRSLVDKKYVDSSTTANNGLTKVGKNIRLGGVLTGETLISNLVPRYVSDQSVKDFDNFATTVAIQPDDNKILVGGFFTTYDGVTSNSIVRINADGSIDDTFVTGTGFDNYVHAIAVQSDNKVLVGGEFSTYSGASANYIIRLNPDGSIDDTFQFGSGFDNSVRSIVIQSNGKIVIGGFFNTYSGATANYMVRLNTNGTIDDTFSGATLFDGFIWDVVLRSDDYIYACGTFSTPWNGIVRLTPDGDVDLTFDPGSGSNSGFIRTIEIQLDDKILGGGNLGQFDGITVGSGIVRLETDGSVDTSFNTGAGFSNDVFDIQALPDGRLLFVGAFTTYSGLTVNHIVVLNDDGSIADDDYSFGVGFGGGGGNAIAYQSFDNKIVIVGYFSSYDDQVANYIIRLEDGLAPSDLVRFTDGGLEYGYDFSATYNDRSLVDKKYVDNVVTGQTKAANGLTRVEDTIILGGKLTGQTSLTDTILAGYVDETFQYGTGFNIHVYDIKLQSDNKILVCGAFTEYSGITANRIARLNPDGTLDDTFNSISGFNQEAYEMFIQSDGRIVVAGNYASYSGVSSNGVIRLNTDGTVDDTFVTGGGFNAFNPAYTIDGQSDDKSILGGAFTSYSGISTNRIVRLNTDGSFDYTFMTGTGFDSDPEIIRVQPDDKIMVGGQFSTYSGATANRIIRLNSDGTIDDTFNSGTGFDGAVYGIATQGDGKYVIVGNFNNYNGVPTSRIVRLNSNGTLDITFNVGSGLDNTGWDVEVQADGKILAAGWFGTYNGYASSALVRINPDGTMDDTFKVLGGLGLLFTVEIQYNTDNRILVGGFSGSGAIARLMPDVLDFTIVTFHQGGLEYGLDFSATYNNRSLVDKEYVDNLVTGSTIPVGNIVINAPFTAVANSYFIGVSATTGQTITLPASPIAFKPYVVADIFGNASTVNVTIDGNAYLIQGSSTAVINTDYGSITFLFNGYNWSIIAVVA